MTRRAEKGTGKSIRVLDYPIRTTNNKKLIKSDLGCRQEVTLLTLYFGHDELRLIKRAPKPAAIRL